ncbi:hypothetical protein [Paenibacillus tuaregi]|uniref:hypothetical protein n=1 Tax=Paenibacillus tuaregi TaxID=1816681 RepID=UPI00083857BE|nr:hypothetical protein [Paenibacillus tuaregi]
MRKYLGTAHVSGYGEDFGKRVHEYANRVSEDGRELEFHYAQSIEPSGRALFSALIIFYEAAA